MSDDDNNYSCDYSSPSNDDNNYSCDYSSPSNDDNNYSCDYSSPSNDDYYSSYTAAEPETSTYTYTATVPEDDWSEQHEVTAISFSDTQCERPENDSTEDRNTTSTYTPANETIQEYTSTAPSCEIIESREVVDYRTDDVPIPHYDYPRDREYVRVREYNRMTTAPRIHHYKQLNHVSSEFRRECHALDQIDSSKLSNTEFLQWAKRYAEVLDNEERRQNRVRQESVECKNVVIALVATLFGFTIVAFLIFRFSN